MDNGGHLNSDYDTTEYASLLRYHGTANGESILIPTHYLQIKSIFVHASTNKHIDIFSLLYGRSKVQP